MFVLTGEAEQLGTVQTAAYTVTRKLLMMNGVYVRNMQSANFRINTHEKVHLVGLFIQRY